MGTDVPITGAFVGTAVGILVGTNVPTTGAFVGTAVGILVGLFVGLVVGMVEGLDVGSTVGFPVGSKVGFLVGANVPKTGAFVGLKDGTEVGGEVVVLSEGRLDGDELALSLG